MDLVEIFHERAAIIEHEGKQSRAHVEWAAFVELRQIYGRDAIPDEVKRIARKAAEQL